MTSPSFRAVPLLLAAALLAAPQAFAQAPDASTFRGEVATLSLRAERSAAAGAVRGTLAVDLEPGWKTYWLDPGASGIPPHLGFEQTEGVGSARLLAPLPHRFGVGLARANGYDRPVSFPFELRPKPGAAIADPLVADVFIGVCKDICVPVQARLSAPIGPATPATARAFAQLPEDAAPGAVDASLDKETLTLSMRTQATISDAYVTAPDGWYFGEPEMPVREGDRVTITVPVEEQPKTATRPKLDILFDDGARGIAAEGLLPEMRASSG